MAILAVIHVLSAVIGIGPTYFLPTLLRPSLPPGELRGALDVSRRLARYPQIGGPIAVLSGVAMVFATDARLFRETWILGSMVLFVAIQVVIMGFAVPATKKLAAWAFAPGNADPKALPPEAAVHYRRLRTSHVVASLLGTVLFGLMILKPG